VYFIANKMFMDYNTIKGLFLSSLNNGIFFKYLSFYESYSKTGKLRTLFENPPAALKLKANKKGI